MPTHRQKQKHPTRCKLPLLPPLLQLLKPTPPQNPGLCLNRGYPPPIAIVCFNFLTVSHGSCAPTSASKSQAPTVAPEVAERSVTLCPAMAGRRGAERQSWRGSWQSGWF